MKYLNALNKINGVGPKKFSLLLSFFENGENIWNADKSAIIQSGIDEKLSEKIVSERRKINPEMEWARMEKEKVKVISLNDKAYPKLLKEIPSAPHLLYFKSNDLEIDFNDYSMVSIVGSRKFTQYGEQVAMQLSRELTEAGIAIVSGMALGIDAIAHKESLRSGGTTFAIMGSSLEDNAIGPKTNFQLSREIMDSGALISDYPIGTPSTPSMFPARNRIMAGMTSGTIVVEAEEKSGTLITANLALDFNREVFSVPGSIFSPSSRGANELIKKGAKVVMGVSDVLEELNMKRAHSQEKPRVDIVLSEEEKLVLSAIGFEGAHIDRIIKVTTLGASAVLSNLTMLEIKGAIKNIGGQNYIIA